MLCVAVLRVAVLKLAVVTPPLVVNVPWPMLVNPSRKFTNPVGLLGPVPLTVAVNVTCWPDTDGLGDEEIAVAVLLALIWKARIPSTSLNCPPSLTML